MELPSTMTVRVLLVVEEASQIINAGAFHVPSVERIDPDNGLAQMVTVMSDAAPALRVLVGLDEDPSGQYVFGHGVGCTCHRTDAPDTPTTTTPDETDDPPIAFG